MKAYWANDGGEWKMLVFAENVKEAKKTAYKYMPMWGVDWVDVRVWLADQKWMNLYRGVKCEDSHGCDYMTWDEYWEAEHEV